MHWHNIQEEFARALVNPELRAPDMLGTEDNSHTKQRFNVYRNNVAVSLREMLENTFPVIRQLVGEEFFAAMAQVFISNSLPQSPVLIKYGSEFPAFAAAFGPVSNLPYVSDLAKLEYARTTAYHAPDANCATINHLAQLSEDHLNDVQLILHPSLVILMSDWPVFSIWAAHQHEDPEVHLSKLQMNSEYGLVVRPRLDVNVLPVNELTFKFLASLNSGKSLGESAQSLPVLDQNKLSELISGLFESGLVAEVRI